MNLKALSITILALTISSCSDQNVSEKTTTAEPEEAPVFTMDQKVEEYLLLELAMGLHDPAQVDAYFGPNELKLQAESEQLSLEEIGQRAETLSAAITALPDEGIDELIRQRIQSLELRLLALQTRVALAQGTVIPFDEESKLLFDAVAPTFEQAHFEGILAQIDTLLEQNLVRGSGWEEFTLYPLFSPQSLLAEGSANYGIDLAFPGDERIEFERNELFPLAGLDASEAELYYQVMELRSQLNYAGNEAARGYLDGWFTSEQAQEWLVNYALDDPERAEKRIDFYDTYRSYVINYNYGKDLVADWVDAEDADSNNRWEKFTRLLSSPMSPSDLKSPE